ncbi:MAG: flagellar M-ring protein FliF [Fimbriimonas ginsengisoli]|uniref:Flagellar M-ring protein FliF n=1 Tax=Fimbriimonas ginsengisoli TaxID=1005039 RepID=A0A931PU24_FIMGI|nr:flagellar M-ring protein FliF [Fimbriimonas ginsengisoli]
MSGFLLKLRNWWDGADRNQKTLTLLGSGFLSVLLVATFLFASRPHMGLLASGLTGAEQGVIVQELQKTGVPYEMDPQGGINAPVDRIPELRAKLMASGKLSGTGHFGADEELAKLGMATTPRVERERIKAIGEAKLAQDIEFLDNVASARVHIALGDDSPFADAHKTASASVTLSERPGAVITRDQARGIAMMVASAVPNLDPGSVTVLNRLGEPLVDPSDQSGQGRVANKLATERSEAKRRERELQQKLDSAFGPGTTIADVNVEIDFEGKDYTEIQRKPSDPLVTEENTEKMTGTASGLAGAVGGLAGVASNTPAAAPAAATAAPATPTGQGYENKAKASTYVLNEKTTRGQDPAGKLKSMSISVLVDEDKLKDSAPVQAFLTSYLGAKATDPAFTAKVTTAKFDTTSAKAAAESVAASASREKIQQVLSILPILALVGVAAMLLKALSKAGKTQQLVVATVDGHLIPLPGSGIPISADQLGSGVRVSAGVPVLSGVSSGGGSSGGGGVRLGRSDEPDVEIDAIKRKINVPLEQIKRMSTERPEVVAMLLKSWLLDDRR